MYTAVYSCTTSAPRTSSCLACTVPQGTPLSTYIYDNIFHFEDDKGAHGGCFGHVAPGGALAPPELGAFA